MNRMRSLLWAECRGVVAVVAMVIGAMMGPVAWGQMMQGACCASGTGCVVTSMSACQVSGGLFLGTTTCAECDQRGGCCLGAGQCVTSFTPGQCLAQNGQYYPAGTACGPTNCGAGAGGACCNGTSGACVIAGSLTACPGTQGLFYPGTTCNPSPCGPQGACCNTTTGQCTLTTAPGCGNGSWLSAGTCTAGVACVIGACCNAATDICVLTTQANCLAPYQFFSGISCTTQPCLPQVVCCVQLGASCYIMSKPQCMATYGGLVMMNSTSCSPNPCLQIGACCSVNGCSVLPPGQCGSGLPYTLGATCINLVCPPYTWGACCQQSGCTIVNIGMCPSPYQWISGGTCSVFSSGWHCPPPSGACCIPGQACFVSYQGTCFVNGVVGVWHGWMTCTPNNPCAATGACCGGGLCAAGQTSAACTGTFFLNGSCVPNPCGLGACCDRTTGSCLLVEQATCNRRGVVYLGDNVQCTPQTCAPLTGACCNATTGSCFIATFNQCQARPLGWYSSSTCAPNPCRRADFNGDQTVSIQDIFDFLTVWFGGTL
jgi:hypothetical protein